MTGWLVRGTRGAVRATAVPLILALLLLAAVVAGPAPKASAAEHESGLEVDLTSISPPFLRPGVPLTVAGTLTNHTDAEVTGATVSLRLQRNGPRTRSAVDFWLDLDITFATLLLARSSLEEALAPGDSWPFRLTVQPEDFPLPAVASAFGSRGIAVDAEGRGESGPLEDTSRTLLVWYPGSTAVPTTVSVLVPLVPTASEMIGAALGGTTVAEKSSARIVDLASATAGAPAVSWALDPLLLEGLDPVDEAAEPADEATDPAPTPSDGRSPQPSVENAAVTPTTAPSATPRPAPAPDEPTANLGDVLRSLAEGREVLALPYADADAAATTHAGANELYDRAVATGRDLLAGGGITTTEDIAWPAAPTPDTATVSALAARGASAVILPETSLPSASTLTYTPSGRGTLTVDGDDDARIAALLAERALSAALAGTAPAPGRADQSNAARALDARQYVLAVTAMITRERPADGRHVLAVLPRTFAGDSTALAERLAVLSAAPWVTPAPISALRDLTDPDVSRGGLPDERVAGTEAPPELLAEVVATSDALSGFAAIAEDPALLVRPEQRRLLQVISAAWRADTTGRVAFMNANAAAAAAVHERVGVASSGTVNLISDTGDLPVTVRNALDQPITARLRLTPDGPSLQLPDLVTVQVPAGSEVAFPVRVHAVGSADVQVRAELIDAAGQKLGTSATLVVRVRADWENVGTAILAAIVGLAFIVGLVRSIRRSGRRGDAAPSPGDAST